MAAAGPVLQAIRLQPSLFLKPRQKQPPYHPAAALLLLHLRMVMLQPKLIRNRHLH